MGERSVAIHREVRALIPSLIRMLKKSASSVLASFRSSTYPRGYASALHSLRPCWTVFLSILWECSPVVSYLQTIEVLRARIVFPQSATHRHRARLDHGLTEGLRLKRRLRCGPGGRLLEWHPRTASREERGKRDPRHRRDPNFDLRGSKFRKARTSDLEPSLVPPVSCGGHPDWPMTSDSIVYA